ncbi:MAG: hypothetical protein UR60_C0010G0019 [Candidatus Moranbacteria bacterium GW2011_GWF2_34_56]|nr:MAG: hypothetical protein UR51_C0001G0042 [Candidatus Moranbacteria bacterium GW2011_GWF1_34_10]KKP65030.1 MAG: hypothetical protein UR60_C0010G0019 [Candidatus Moranbacteria bacterium GW2011_GWF2_34_56]HBI16939.1 hypothetical protein [Candidatus Moranbacteria bacterium]
MNFLKQTRYSLLIAISAILTLNSYFFIERKSTNAFPMIFDNIKIHYLIYIACFAGLGYVLWKFFKNEKISQLAKTFLLTFLPTEIVFILGFYILNSETKAHFFFYFLTGFYLLSWALFFIETKNNFASKEKTNSLKWLKNQGLSTLIILFIALSTFGYFATHKIENYAGVDEPLWTFDRIPYFWKNVGEMDWKNTSISDKPGITVVEIAGIGLFFNKPLEYAKLDNFDSQKDIRQMNKAFRLPLVIFCLLSLILFYIFIQELLGKRVALLSIVFISTSPMLIGMSRIINPDAILWVFAPLTILAYLIFLKKETRFWLYLSGFLLGLAILTKYVANILYIFFFGLIFLEYLFKTKKENITQYLKKSFTHFFSVVLISLVTFFILFPETWVNLSKLFTGTILSQAFIVIAPIFIALALFLIIDTFILKNKITQPILNFFFKNRKYLMFFIVGLFCAFIVFVFLNTYLKMQWVDFENILSSPKTSHRFNSFLAIFSANFYPLIFASLPIVILGLASAIFIFFNKKREHNREIKIIFYFITFILLYYFATTFNEVVSTIRYQVILYPLLLITSALGISKLLKLPKQSHGFEITAALLLAISFYTLLNTQPHYLGYASFLLPKNYIVDVKDMGDGSYEVAEYLNSLPDAQNLSIWTDKKGVCAFFIGQCDSFYDTLSFENSPGLNYFVISSGRENKILNETRNKTSLPYDFEKIYNSTEAEFNLFIGNREGNYVKILKAQDFKK